MPTRRTPPSAAWLVPVTIVPEPDCRKSAAPAPTQSHIIEIEVGGDCRVRVGSDFDARALKRVLDLEPRYQQLAADLQLAEKALAAAEATWDAAKQKEALGQGHFSSLKQVEEASLPLEKTAPNRSKLILAATLVGLFLGLGLVLLMALPDTVVRTRDDLEGIEGLAVIGVMPRLESRNIKRHGYRRSRGW